MIRHTLHPALAADTPALAATAHHGAVADAQVTNPTDRAINTASVGLEPVGDASLRAAASPAAVAATSAAGSSNRLSRPGALRQGPVVLPRPIGERRYPPPERRWFRPLWVPEAGTVDGTNGWFTRRRGR